MLQKNYKEYLDNMMLRMENAKNQKCPKCNQSKWGMTVEPTISLVCFNCDYSYVDELLVRKISPYLPSTQKKYDENKKQPLFQ